MRNGSYKRGEEIFAPLPLFLGHSPKRNVIAVVFNMHPCHREADRPWRSPGTMGQTGRYYREIAASPLLAAPRNDIKKGILRVSI